MRTVRMVAALTLIGLFTASSLVISFVQPALAESGGTSNPRSSVSSPLVMGNPDGGWVLGAYDDFGGPTGVPALTVEYNIAIPTFTGDYLFIDPGVMTAGGKCALTWDNGTTKSPSYCIYQNDIYYMKDYSVNNNQGGQTILNGFYWESEIWGWNGSTYAIQYRSGYNCVTWHCRVDNVTYYTLMSTSALSKVSSTIQTGPSPNYYLQMSTSLGQSITYTQVNFNNPNLEMEIPIVMVPSFVLEAQDGGNLLASFSEQASFSPSTSCVGPCSAPFVYCGIECYANGTTPMYTNPPAKFGFVLGSCLVIFGQYHCEHVFSSNVAQHLQFNSYSGFPYGWQLSFNDGGISWNNMASEIASGKNPSYGALEPFQTWQYLNSCSASTPAQQNTKPVNNSTTGPTPALSCKSSFKISFQNIVTKGDLLAVMVGTYAIGATFTVSDPTGSGGQGNTWSSAISQCGNDCVQVFYAVTKASGSETVTVTTTASSTYTYGFIAEYGGLSNAPDNSSPGYGSIGNPHVNSFTPSIGTVVFAVAAGCSGWTPTTGYQMISKNTGWNVASEFAVDWNGASTTAQWTANSYNAWGEVAASFK